MNRTRVLLSLLAGLVVLAVGIAAPLVIALVTRSGGEVLTGTDY